MTKANTVIEINGKSYDALSGKLITPSHTVKPHKLQPAGSHVDGVVSKPRKHPSSAHHTARKVDHSRTLMRNAVKKPTHIVKTSSHQSRSITYSHAEEIRLEHAKAIAKNPKISRFGPAHPVISKLTQILPVKEAPPEEPLVLSHHGALSLPVGNLANQLSQAIEHATTHNQPRARKTTLRSKAARKLRVSPKTVNIGAASLAIVLLAGFISYQNVPNLSMRVAAARAGVNANLPHYQPAGFSLRGPIESLPGQVTVNYHSNSDNRQFSVTQHASNWDNASLLENYVALNQRSYQTYQTDNKTIYIFDGSNATWIDNGVWYKVEGKSSLNSDQLLRIAGSI